jgi:hypothetical protein
LVLVVTALPSFAQRGFGGRMMGGTNRVQLCSLKEVQAELKFSDEQKKLATEVYEKYNADRREAMQNAGGDFAAAMEKGAKLAADATTKISEKLSPEQKSRLTQLFVQVGGTNALLDADVQKELKVTEDQAKRLTAARDANREAMRSLFGDLQNASPEERQKKTDEYQKGADEQMFACITADQKAAFEKMGGSRIQIDLSPLAPRRQQN